MARMRWRPFLGVVIAMCGGCAVVAGLNQDYRADGAADDASFDAAADAALDAGGGGGAPASCKDLLALDPAKAGHDGVYTIVPRNPDAGASLRVFCQMSLDDGGWTLVGRSSVSAQPFGWDAAAGSLDDIAGSYSLGVLGVGITFHEVLLADHTSSALDVATRAYKLAVPSTFFTVNGGSVSTAAITTVLGDCMPPGGPQMLRHTGVLNRADSFFFRDIDDPSQSTGLKSTGFDLTYADCPRGGMLHNTAGLIFVR